MRKVLGVFFVILSTVIGVVVLLTWSIRTSLLASEPWKSSLREARVYDRLLVEALPEIVSGDTFSNGVTKDAPLMPSDLIAIAQSTITADFLQQQVERGFDVTFDLLNSRTTLATAEFVIPLQDIKRRLPIAVQERLVTRVQALPICTADQIKDFEKLKTLNNALPPCRPKGLDVQAIVRDSLKVDEIAANIPSTFDVIAELQKQRNNDEEKKIDEKKQDNSKLKAGTTQQKDEGVMKAAENKQPSTENSKTVAEQVAFIQEKIQFAFQVQLYLTLAWAVLLLGLGALFIPHWRRVMQWFAIGLFIPSTLLVAGTLIGRGEIPENFTVSDHSAQVVVNILVPAGTSLVHILSSRLLIIGGAGVVAAIIIFTLAFSFARKRVAH